MRRTCCLIPFSVSPPAHATLSTWRRRDVVQFPAQPVRRSGAAQASNHRPIAREPSTPILPAPRPTHGKREELDPLQENSATWPQLPNRRPSPPCPPAALPCP